MKEKLIERKPYMQMLRNLKEQHIIKVITGMRRSGKSTLLEMLATEIRQSVNEKQIQFLNFEDLDTLSIGNYSQIYRHISKKLAPDRMNYIFLDEVQNIDGFERIVDSLYIKKNVDLYITGSNAYLLSSELATLLTGRYIEINILPFSFEEYTLSVTNPQNFTKKENFADLQKIDSLNLSKDELLVDFIYNGSMPQAISMRYFVPEQENEFTKAILNTIIEKDIFKRRTIYNKQTFNKIVDFLLDTISSYISPNSIVNALKNDKIIIDNETVTNYLNYLAETYLLYKVPRYDIKGKNLLKTLDKYYLADTGFRKARLGKKVTEDRGHLLENMVYLELRRRNSEVYVGKLRDKEIDFVTIDNKGYVSYYQVAYSVKDEKTLERELAPLKSIKDSNPKYLLSTDWDANPVYDGIRKYNVIDWMLDTKKVKI
jgi:predicted AAA+ superfamily ATPase